MQRFLSGILFEISLNSSGEREPSRAVVLAGSDRGQDDSRGQPRCGARGDRERLGGVGKGTELGIAWPHWRTQDRSLMTISASIGSMIVMLMSMLSSASAALFRRGGHTETQIVSWAPRRARAGFNHCVHAQHKRRGSAERQPCRMSQERRRVPEADDSSATRSGAGTPLPELVSLSRIQQPFRLSTARVSRDGRAPGYSPAVLSQWHDASGCARRRIVGASVASLAGLASTVALPCGMCPCCGTTRSRLRFRDSHEGEAWLVRGAADRLNPPTQQQSCW